MRRSAFAAASGAICELARQVGEASACCHQGALGYCGMGESMPVQPWLISEGVWMHVKDANPTALDIFHRHYSYRPYKDGRKPLHFVGPGEKMVLLTADADALFVWRKFKSGDGQQGVNCAVFRNEGPVRASDLIIEAMTLAWGRWPGSRLYTYVNPRKLKSSNPGYCFLRAGWRKCGITRVNKLLILEREG